MRKGKTGSRINWSSSTPYTVGNIHANGEFSARAKRGDGGQANILTPQGSGTVPSKEGERHQRRDRHRTQWGGIACGRRGQNK